MTPLLSVPALGLPPSIHFPGRMGHSALSTIFERVYNSIRTKSSVGEDIMGAGDKSEYAKIDPKTGQMTPPKERPMGVTILAIM
jgi:hypothetical protein